MISISGKLKSMTNAGRLVTRMKKFNVSIVYDNGTSSQITGFKSETKAKAFVDIAYNPFYNMNQVLSITIVEDKGEEIN